MINLSGSLKYLVLLYVKNLLLIHYYIHLVSNFLNYVPQTFSRVICSSSVNFCPKNVPAINSFIKGQHNSHVLWTCIGEPRFNTIFSLKQAQISKFVRLLCLNISQSRIFCADIGQWHQGDTPKASFDHCKFMISMFVHKDNYKSWLKIHIMLLHFTRLFFSL